MVSDQFDLRILELVNIERTKRELDPLSIDSQLDQAANFHNDEMVRADIMSHQLPGEADLGERVSATGYSWTRVAENIAAGYTTPEAVVEGWMNSPGHKENILNPEFIHIGIGYEYAADENNAFDDYDVYWTQVFATDVFNF